MDSDLKKLFTFSPLHNRLDLIDQCCEMLNKEWPRCRTSRCSWLHSLEKSCDKLPCSLVLIEHAGSDHVVGHSRITPIHGHKQACLLESLVIEKEKRGKGLGKLIMKETEEFAKKLGINTIFLSTKDKQEFYKHIGYVYCEPLCLYGNNIKLPTETEIKLKDISSVADENFPRDPPQSQVPKAPPLPKSIYTLNNKSEKQWMRKQL